MVHGLSSDFEVGVTLKFLERSFGSIFWIDDTLIVHKSERKTYLALRILIKK